MMKMQVKWELEEFKEIVQVILVYLLEKKILKDLKEMSTEWIMILKKELQLVSQAKHLKEELQNLFEIFIVEKKELLKFQMKK